MPCITIVNDTEVPLHIALRHISPVYYENNVAPGGRAVFKHVGRVWFTVEARVARSAQQPQQQGGVGSSGGGQDATIEEVADTTETTSGAATGKPTETTTKAAADASSSAKQQKRAAAAANNEYTLFQQVAAPVAVSVAALSLGAGAIYVGMAASAAGGLSAALSTISAQVTTAAATQAPTARRLYTFAKKGQKVVQIGQVLGIGGGAWLGSHAAAGAVKEDEATAEAATTTNDVERIKQVKKVLMELIEHAAVKSHGWYMGRDRTIRIRGGPRAAEVEKWLIIETDTVTPFEVLSDDPNDDKPDPAAQEKAMAEEVAATGGARSATAPATDKAV